MLFFILVFIPGICAALDNVTVPWDEFKTLYKESIEKNVLEKQGAQPFIYSIEQGFYKITH